VGEIEDRRWKVGELAKATGLTVRTLHHYDDVGLLVPWERTSAGHRLYADQDVRRLYHILALRGLGLGLEEIASLLDDADVSLLDTVRRHLEQVERELEHRHRLRLRLRRILDALERSVDPAVDEFIDAMEAMTVIETDVQDVFMRLPAEEAEEPPPRLAREGYRIVLLRERGGGRVLPIWVGAQEGDLLAARLGEWSHPRPMGPDLTARLLEAGGVRVERVVIESVREVTFYASITVTAGGESHEVDARPSDALNLAVRVGAPVFVAADLLDQSGLHPWMVAKTHEEWRSLSPDLMRSLYPREARVGWERYTRQAQHVMRFAQEEARASGHDRVAPGHLLVGLLREQDGLAAAVLDSLDVTLERARGRLAQTGDAGEATPGLILYSPDAQKIFELALSEEGTRHPQRVGTEHILLGLVGADEDALLAVGVGADRVREEVHRAAAALSADESSTGESGYR
jgi:bifunctional DNase/RNase/DNA-binding transcriptional MerR regulator